MLIDTHCHLYGEQYEGRDIIKEIEDDKNLLYVITLSSDEEDAKKCFEISQKSKKVFFAVGFHPENVDSLKEDSLLKIEKLASSPKCVAVRSASDYSYPY